MARARSKRSASEKKNTAGPLRSDSSPEKPPQLEIKGKGQPIAAKVSLKKASLKKPSAHKVNPKKRAPKQGSLWVNLLKVFTSTPNAPENWIERLIKTHKIVIFGDQTNTANAGQFFLQRQMPHHIEKFGILLGKEFDEIFENTLLEMTGRAQGPWIFVVGEFVAPNGDEDLNQWRKWNWKKLGMRLKKRWESDF